MLRFRGCTAIQVYSSPPHYNRREPWLRILLAERQLLNTLRCATAQAWLSFPTDRTFPSYSYAPAKFLARLACHNCLSGLDRWSAGFAFAPCGIRNNFPSHPWHSRSAPPHLRRMDTFLRGMHPFPGCQIDHSPSLHPPARDRVGPFQALAAQHRPVLSPPWNRRHACRRGGKRHDSLRVDYHPQ